MIRLSSATIFAAAYIICYLPNCLAQTGGDPPKRVFLGYVHGMPPKINYGLYTHLCHAFVVAEKDGTLIPQRNVPNRDLTTGAHRAGVKVLLSVGGWGWDANFAEMSLNPEAEARYVAGVMELVEEFDYDGIDLDWEYPDTNIEIVGFERLARKFHHELSLLGNKKNRSVLLTMAASAHPKTLSWLKSDFLLETMDWVNLMTYDYCGSWARFAGHHAPMFTSSKMPEGEALSAQTTINYLRERGFPAQRVVLGIPLYGRAFTVAEPYASLEFAPKPAQEFVNYNKLQLLATRPGWTRKWDDETKNPWLVNPDKPEIIGYDDAESVIIKVNWAVEEDLRGVFFWQVNADRMPDGSNPLQETAYTILRSNSN